MARHAEPVIDPEWSAFLQDGVAIVASSRTGSNVPCLARASGCRLSANRRTLTALFSRSRSRPFLEAVAASGAIALVVTRPSTHVSLQLKGDDARVGAPRATDPRLVARYVRAFAEDLGAIGYSEAFTRNLAGCDAADLAAVTFTPRAVYLQTPGPRAGQPLLAASAAGR